MPTLIITFELDAAADKMRKRRSSRSGQLTSSSSSYPNSLLFRTINEEKFSIYDWQVMIQPRIRLNRGDPNGMISPEAAPTFNSFINPFAKRSHAPELQSLASSKQKPEFYHRNSHTTEASYKSALRERAQTSTLISPSPSLRSRRSDLSSQASSLSRPQGWNTTLPIQQMPADLPSPASTLGYEDQFISGWTSAQGRSSTLSSHTRGSNSVSIAGTPPAPRETILDRAFMMRYIPGSERGSAADGESAQGMSSIARFEALMREHDERKSLQSRSGPRKGSNAWELEEEEEEEDDDDDSDADAESDVDPGLAGKRKGYAMSNADDEEDLSLSIHTIPTPAQRALEYISGRTPLPTHRPSSSKSSKTTPPVPYISDRHHPMPAKSKTRPRPMSMALPNMNNMNAAAVTGTDETPQLDRRSSNSQKRLSFTEFTKRLSSTSSLLLVQTNNPGSGSSRNSRGSSSEASYLADDVEREEKGLQRGLSQSRLSGMMTGGRRENATAIQAQQIQDDKRCVPAWRGSGLAFGGEGGFL
jgi:hypothetical protein